MTTLLLGQRKILPSRFFIAEEVSEKVLIFGARRIITGALAALIGVSILGYLVAVYASFSLGFQLQNQAKNQEALSKEAVGLELLAQERINLIAYEQKGVVESMEKVSAIKYLTPANFVASQLPLHP